MARADALAEAISDRKVPFLWVGVPAFKSPKMLSDMLAFNDIYREVGGRRRRRVRRYLGRLRRRERRLSSSTGPDINGQPVRLRGSDGINLTRPGKRKVAFYVEKPLYKMLGETASPGCCELRARPICRGPCCRRSMSARSTGPCRYRCRIPSSMAAAELLGLVAAPKRDARSPGEKLAVEGIAPAAVPGRADDFPGSRRRLADHRAALADRRTVAADPADHRRQAAEQQPAYRGSTVVPISASSIARAAWRPSRIAHTTSDWPRRMSPAANTLSTLVR